MYSSHHMKD